MQSVLYEILYYIYILIFGVYVSLRIACDALRAKEWRIFGGLCPLLLLLQGVCLHLLGMDKLWMLYPLITHLPTVLILALPLKIRWDRALTAVAISYSLCQLPRWAGLVLSAAGLAGPVEFILHLALSHGILLLLNRYCLSAIHTVLSSFHHPLWRIGALPLIYYLYEYFMVFTERRYAGILALNELIPTGMVLFFILFIIAYQHEMEKRACAEQQNTAMEMKLTRAEQEITLLRAIQEQTAIYRHDLRHHLMMIDGMLAAGRQEQIPAYIRGVQSEIEAIVPVRYCENETVNLLLGAFKSRVESKGILLSVKAALPATLNLPDSELCALLSNGLENAVNAVARLPESGDRLIDLYCALRQGKLLIEIKNPYIGEITMRNGLPQAKDPAHGYGCRSIQSIVQRRKGVCSFDPGQKAFTLRIAIPLK